MESEREKGSGSSYTYDIQFMNHTCTVNTEIDIARKWATFLNPFFSIRRKLEDADIRFFVEENPQLVDDLLAAHEDAPPIHLHCGALGRVIEEKPGHLVVVSPALQTVYIVEPCRDQSTITYICREFSHEIDLDLLRLVRGILVGLAQSSKMKKVHVSAVAQEKGIAFVGKKDAGKTSFMLAFLQQVREASLIANDKALVSESQNNLVMWGLPYAVSIGFGALQCCANIPFDEQTRIIGDKAYFWPRELSQYMGRPISLSSPVEAVVQVQIDVARNDLKTRDIPLEERRKIIQEEIFTFSDMVDPHWLLNFLDIAPAQNQRVRDLLMQKEWYCFYGNPWNGNLKKTMETHDLVV
jgi:hypothetical protein